MNSKVLIFLLSLLVTNSLAFSQVIVDTKDLALPDTLNNIAQPSDSLRNLQGAELIYMPDSYWKQLFDSVGTQLPPLNLANPAWNTTEGISETVSEEKFLEHINKVNGISGKGGHEFMSLEEFSVSDWDGVSLPDSLLENLAPMSTRVLDTLSIPHIDSMLAKSQVPQSVRMSRKVTESGKEVITMEDRGGFWDKTFLEGILGFSPENGLKRVSSAFAYYLNSKVSIGIGPSLDMNSDELSQGLWLGGRSQLKIELFDQKAYIQLEDTYYPTAPNRQEIANPGENLRVARHDVQIGVGGLINTSLPVKLNFSGFYSLSDSFNKDTSNQFGTPWSIRIGISTINKK